MIKLVKKLQNSLRYPATPTQINSAPKNNSISNAIEIEGKHKKSMDRAFHYIHSGRCCNETWNEQEYVAQSNEMSIFRLVWCCVVRTNGKAHEPEHLHHGHWELSVLHWTTTTTTNTAHGMVESERDLFTCLRWMRFVCPVLQHLIVHTNNKQQQHKTARRRRLWKPKKKWWRTMQALDSKVWGDDLFVSTKEKKKPASATCFFSLFLSFDVSYLGAAAVYACVLTRLSWACRSASVRTQRVCVLLLFSFGWLLLRQCMNMTAWDSQYDKEEWIRIHSHICSIT